MSEVTTTGASSLANFIERASRDDSFSLEKFRELVLMQRDAERSFARHEFNAAMAHVQAEMQTISRDRNNPATRSNYATLQAIDAVARPIYTRHGFSIRFGTGPAPEGWVRVTCELAHASGYSESHYLDGPLDISGAQGRTNKTGIQAIGSTVSYLRRYLLLLVLNLVTADDDDDDGEATRRVMDQRAANAYPARAAAAAMPSAPRKRQTIAEWLEAHRIALHDCQSREEVDAILESEEVARARETFRNGAKEQLETMITEALAKWYHDPPAGDEEPEDLAAMALP